MLKDIYNKMVVYTNIGSDLEKKLVELLNKNRENYTIYWPTPFTHKIVIKNVFYGTEWKIEELMKTERN